MDVSSLEEVPGTADKIVFKRLGTVDAWNYEKQEF